MDKMKIPTHLLDMMKVKIPIQLWDNSQRSAIDRRAPSAPMSWLWSHGYLGPRATPQRHGRPPDSGFRVWAGFRRGPLRTGAV